MNKAVEKALANKEKADAALAEAHKLNREEFRAKLAELFTEYQLCLEAHFRNDDVCDLEIVEMDGGRYSVEQLPK